MIDGDATLRQVLESVEICLNDGLSSGLPESCFEEKIYKLRMSKGLGRDDFAKLVGIHTSTVQGWEKGLKKPTKRLIEKVCTAFGLDAGYFDE